MLSPFAKVAPYKPEVTEGGCGSQTYLRCSLPFLASPPRRGPRIHFASCPTIAPQSGPRALRASVAVVPRPVQGRELVVVFVLYSIQPLQPPGSFQLQRHLLRQRPQVEAL